jgi:hypothetical protein
MSIAVAMSIEQRRIKWATNRHPYKQMASILNGIAGTKNQRASIKQI